jgi:branched-chain amino acid aminotransferase
MHPHCYIHTHILILQASQLTVQQADAPKPLTPNAQLVFGRTFSDHMLSIAYDSTKDGWSAPRVTPYGPISLEPSACVLHYGMEVRVLAHFSRVNDSALRA